MDTCKSIKETISMGLKRITPTKKTLVENVLLISTFIASIPIVVTLLYNYVSDCKHTYIIVPYQQELSPCYFQASVTTQIIQDTLLQFGYSAEVTDSSTLTQTPAFYSNGLGIYYTYMLFTGYASTVIHLLEMPSYIPTSYRNYSYIINTHGLQQGGIIIGLNSWTKQMNSQRITPFTFSQELPFQIPLHFTDGTYEADLVFTYNENCAIVGTVNGSPLGGQKPLDNGICIYVYDANKGIFDAVSFCEKYNCQDLVDYATNITMLLKNDFENNVFQVKTLPMYANYALPDHCQISNCIGLPLYQTLLLCISTASSVFIASKFFRYVYETKKSKNRSMKILKCMTSIAVTAPHFNDNNARDNNATNSTNLTDTSGSSIPYESTRGSDSV